MNKITYVSYYDVLNTKEKRKYAISSKNKSDYIIEKLEQVGYRVNLLSASGVNGGMYSKGRKEAIGKHSQLLLFASIGDNNVFKRVVDRNLIKIKLFFQLLRQKKDSLVLAYHSLGYINPLRLAHMIKRFKLILEVEEIYSDVLVDRRKKKRELRFLRTADGYLFPTILLHKSVNISEKPYIVVHGTYHVEPKRGNETKNENDGRIIHCVYSGTLDPRKGGIAAVTAARYLSP